MSTFTTGDTAPDFTATLTSAGVAANLAGAAVELHFTKPSGVTLTKVGTIVSAAAGTIAYTWVTGDLVEAGPWGWEAQVTFSNGRIQTFPGSAFVVGAQRA